MVKKYRISAFLLGALVLVFGTSVAILRTSPSANTPRQAPIAVTVKTVDTSGNPLNGVEIVANGVRKTTANDGSVLIPFRSVGLHTIHFRDAASKAKYTSSSGNTIQVTNAGQEVSFTLYYSTAQLPRPISDPNATVPPQTTPQLPVGNAVPAPAFGVTNEYKAAWVQWNNRPGYSHIEIYRASSGGPTRSYTKVATVPAFPTKYFDRGLESRKVYYYKLKAVNAQGVASDYSREMGVRAR